MSNIHNPANMPTEEISLMGEAIGQEYHIYDTEGVTDLNTLISKLGGSVITLWRNTRNTQEASTEIIFIHDENDFDINIARNTSHAHDRLYTAKALGHYFLHFLGERAKSEDGLTPRQAIFRNVRGHESTNERILREEVESFAGGLLLPKDLVEANSPKDAVRKFGLPKWFVDDRYSVVQKKN